MALLDKGTLLVKNGKLIDLESTGAGRDVGILIGDNLVTFWNQSITVETLNYVTEMEKLRKEVEQKQDALQEESDNLTYDDWKNKTEKYKSYSAKRKEIMKEFYEKKEILDTEQEQIFGKENRTDDAFRLYLDEITSETYSYLDEGYGFTSIVTVFKKYAPQEVSFLGIKFIIKRLTCGQVYSVKVTVGKDKYTIIQGYDVDTKTYYNKQTAETIRKYLNNKCLSRDNKLSKDYFQLIK